MSSIAPAAQNQQSFQRNYPAIPSYVVLPLSASIAIIPSFRDMIAKSSLQKGEPIPSISLLNGLKEGMKAAPIVGVIVGSQMFLQNKIENAFAKNREKNLPTMMASAATVGIISSPILAIFNGMTAGLSLQESCKKFSPKQGVAIAIQESAFVAGLSAADPLGVKMKQQFGDNKVVEYIAAFISGAMGSLAGHPANTALTRWQSNMQVDGLHQLMWGSIRKARAIGMFSIFYKFGKENFPFKE